MPEYFGYDSEPITQEEWSQLFGDRPQSDRWPTGKDTVGDWEVSTVWLGLDHSFGAGDRPLIFETMVFAKDTVDEQACRRYATEEEALAGHNAVVAQLKEGVSPVDLDK